MRREFKSRGERAVVLDVVDRHTPAAGRSMTRRGSAGLGMSEGDGVGTRWGLDMAASVPGTLRH
jgi:hypothetical protein